MITVQNVSKSFAKIPILKNISFEIVKGEIIGFLGPNGAGKTTLMRILTSYLPPDKGKIVVAGYDLAKDSLGARKRLGYLPENPPLYPEMTVRHYLKFAARLKDIEYRQINHRVDEILEKCTIADVQHQNIGTLSKGYKQRVGIAQAIIHDPEVLILDEPTVGLDPLQIIQVRQLIKNLEYKRTVILSTHILAEIEQIAKRVIIIKNGEIVADQPLNSLLGNSFNVPPPSKLEEVFLKLTAD